MHQHKPQSQVVIGICAANFAGAGKIATTALREFTRNGIPTYYVGFDVPHLYADSGRSDPSMRLASAIHSDAITERATFACHALAEKALEVAEENQSATEVCIWGTYLFPYAHAALLAKQILVSRGRSARLVVSPAGSDIWQIGPQLTRVAGYLLFNSSVDARLTYTDQFAGEIRKMFNTSAAIETIYPILDIERFTPINDEQKGQLRSRSNFCREAFIICCHCNMRPIKRPGEVMRLADGLAHKLRDRQVILLMAGPKPVSNPYPVSAPNLQVIWLGVVNAVEHILQISDVAVNWSAHDSFNASLMEAMGCGIPVLSSSVVGIGPEIIAGRAGAVFDDNEFNGAIEFLNGLACNAALRQEMATRAAHHARVTFNARLLMPRYLEVLLSTPTSSHARAAAAEG
jgi:glycosyltransferase involved in cell wall biosynthesis